MTTSLREALAVLGGSLAVPALAAEQRGATAQGCSALIGSSERPGIRWGKTFEGQRKADLGTGRYQNPIFPGDFPDPTILRDGDDYYMTFSSFEAEPGLMIWHSRDLLNWSPIGPALKKPIGSVFAVDLVKHDGRFFLYIPFMATAWSRAAGYKSGVHVIWADDIRGPWSDPVPVGADRIDPGHIVGEDGKRYLFLSGIGRVRLSDDGLRAETPVTDVYSGWRYPDDWIPEAYSLEGPKLFRRGNLFYLVTAVGGTAGPPTGHMVIIARSRSVNGPWENCPHNPIVRTRSDTEPWWSRGHGTMFEGPGGQWWMVYHAYENGFRTLGRQTLLEPIEWTKDGWPVAREGDGGNPIAAPRARQASAGAAGFPRSDAFASGQLSPRWVVFAPGADETRRATFDAGALVLAGKGKTPGETSPLLSTVGDHAYEVTVGCELVGDAEGGLLLFLCNRLFLGLGMNGKGLTTYAGGRIHHYRERNAPASRTMHLRIVNDRHIITFYYSLDGQSWTRHGLRLEASGYHANTIIPGEGESLRPALFATGSGSVRYTNFRYRALR